jgi:hypothetical protein
MSTIKRFNWVRSPSAWERSQAWRERQAELRANFETASSAANTRFFSASIDQTTGLGQIAAQTASRRIQAEAVRRALSQLA